MNEAERVALGNNSYFIFPAIAEEVGYLTAILERKIVEELAEKLKIFLTEFNTGQRCQLLLLHHLHEKAQIWISTK